ncbi:MAG: ribonuclease G [Succinivibrionaceae bacterium]|nr:ribonuclease G [Succinivibrionaceae bacterium]
MSVELLINVTPVETRVALVEQGILQEVHVERQTKLGMVGNIYKGRVTRILPGMQAAFVDIGMDKAAFLHASDIVPHTECVNPEEKEHFPVQDIARLVSQGQHIIVQVVKDPIGTKGARLTTDITLPSRYLVFMPGSSHVGVSQKIRSPEERERLKICVEKHITDDGGFIVRTAAEGVSEKELEQDASFLAYVWNQIKAKRRLVKDCAMLYEDLPLAFRLLRDFVGSPIDKIRVDSRSTCDELRNFCNEFIPEVAGSIELYEGLAPLFDMYDVEAEIQRALDRKVLLKSGGYLIIDQTEAMTTIDINTGAFVGHRNLEETIFNTNIEATKAIARQLRLRNLGGIIIIDFIDMQSEDHRRRVLSALEAALSHDRDKTSINGFSHLGLVEMTRKRTRESLGHILCCDCPQCKGRGRIKSVDTVCSEILREVTRVHKSYNVEKYMVYASKEVAEALNNDSQHYLAELEVFLGRQIQVHAEPLYNQEQFDVVMM